MSQPCPVQALRGDTTDHHAREPGPISYAVACRRRRLHNRSSLLHVPRTVTASARLVHRDWERSPSWTISQADTRCHLQLEDGPTSARRCPLQLEGAQLGSGERSLPRQAKSPASSPKASSGILPRVLQNGKSAETALCELVSGVARWCQGDAFAPLHLGNRGRAPTTDARRRHSLPAPAPCPRRSPY